MDPITVSSWDETNSPIAIQGGTALTFALPPHLIYRSVYFYAEARLTNVLSDYFLLGEIWLLKNGQPRSILPASIGSNQLGADLNKSICSVFTSQSYDRNTDGSGKLGNAVGGNALVTFAGQYTSNPSNIGVLAPFKVISAADRFTYVITDWSRAITNVSAAVNGFRAFGLVVSSGAPL